MFIFVDGREVVFDFGGKFDGDVEGTHGTGNSVKLQSNGFIEISDRLRQSNTRRRITALNEA